MPLIMLGIAILIIALVIVPLLVFLFTNPISFGVGLIVLGVIWMIVPKVFYGVIYCFVKIYDYWSEEVIPILRSKKWWQSLVNITRKTLSIIDSDMFGRLFIYILMVLGTILVIYFEYNPIN